MNTDESVSLRSYLDVLIRRKWIMALILIVVVTTGVGLSIRQSDRYRAAATLLLRNSGSEYLVGVADPNNRRDSNVDTEIGVLLSGLVRQQVEDRLGRPVRVRAAAQGDTDIVLLVAEADDASTAAANANTYAEVYVDYKRESTIAEFLRAQETVQRQVDELGRQLAEIEQPIEDLEAQVASAGSEFEVAALNRQILDLSNSTKAPRDSLETQISLYRQQISYLQVGVNVTQTGGAQILTEAGLPSDPFSPNPERAALLSAAIGMMLALGAAFLIDSMDDRIRSKDDLERLTEWPALGLIPLVNRSKADAENETTDLVTVTNRESVAAEAYRGIRTTLQFVALDRPLRSIQITSASAAEGKSMTAANLATVLAQAGRRVVLVDADLRRPRLHRIFDVENDIGFTSILLGTSTPADAFHPTAEPNLFLLPAGPPPPNPSEMLSRNRTRDLVDRLTRECDVLVVDSAPALAVTDPLILSGYVDGVLVVTDAKRARVHDVRRTAELLRQVNAPVLGTIVNRLSADDEMGRAYSYQYGYHYGYHYGEPRQPRPSWRPTANRRRRTEAEGHFEPTGTTPDANATTEEESAAAAPNN